MHILVPGIANFAAELYPDIAFIKYLVLINLYAAAIPFYFALYQAFKLLSYIDKNKLSQNFCESIKENKILRNYNQWPVCGRHAALLSHSGNGRRPGVIVIGMVIIFASIVIAIFAAVLQNSYRKQLI